MADISYSNVNDNTPVFVGSAQLTDKRGIEGYNYLEILTEVSKKLWLIVKLKIIFKKT